MVPVPRMFASAFSPWLLAAGWLLTLATFAGAADDVPRFEDVCFGDFDDADGYPSPEDVRRVFRPVREQSTIIERTRRELAIGSREITRAAGLMRLKSRWEADTTLRLSLLYPGLTYFHFWSGAEGVHFRYCPPAVKSWGAYCITRTGDQPQPAGYTVWGLDNGRYRRAGLGTFEIHWHDGEMLLTRGDLVLLRAPLPSPPSEVFFFTDALVRGAEVYRSEGGPTLSPLSPTVVKWERPAEAQWRFEPAEGVRFEKLAEGPVRLSATTNVEPADASIAIPGPGVFEYVFRLREPQPGSGVFLGDAKGNHLARLAFYRDRSTGRTTFGYLGAELNETELDYDFQRSIVPYAGRRQWLRLTVGGGVMKVWTSGDGRWWSQAMWAPLAVRGGIERVGLYCVAAEGGRSIRLDSFELRRPTAIASLRNAKLAEQAASLGDLGEAETVEDWQRRVVRGRPEGVSAGVWQRACILRTLAENPYFSLGGVLIHRLLDDVLRQPRDTVWKLRLLDEAAMYIPNLDEQGTEPFARHYEGLGMTLLDRRAQPISMLRPAVLASPIWNARHQSAWPDRVLRSALLHLAIGRRWEELAARLESLRFWTRTLRLKGDSLPWDAKTEHIVRWAEWRLARAREAMPPPIIEAAGPMLQQRWIPAIDKATYNVFAELDAALRAGAPREAAAVIVRSARPELTGLLPAAGDLESHVSLPVAVKHALADNPELAAVMRDELAELGNLRLKQAIAAGSASGVEQVTLQFCGTPAAAAAHAWLAERDLSAGRAAGSVRQYLQALHQAAPEHAADWQAGLRLAGAMLGEELGRPVDQSVRLGSQTVPAEEFEAMVAGVLDARRRDVPPPVLSLPPAGYRVRGRLRLSEPIPSGEKSIRYERYAALMGASWIGRRLAVVSAGDRTLIATQHELLAVERQSGETLWSQRTGSRQTLPEDRLGPLRPAPSGDRLFARGLSHGGTTLFCLDAADGRIIWQLPWEGYAASDAICVGEELRVLGVEPRLDRNVLRLLSIDPRSGRITAGFPLAEFRPEPDAALSCRAVAAGGRIVATAAGCVVCCDTQGRVDWIRRQAYVPPPELCTATRLHRPVAWDDRAARRPLVVGDRVFATQPGVFAVECIDLDTGRLVWRTPLPELLAVLGHDGERLFVQTHRAIQARDLGSGAVQWQIANVPRPVSVGQWDRSGAIDYLGTEQGESGEGAGEPLLVRLDPATGRRMTSVPVGIDGFEGRRIGPLVRDGPRYWVAVGPPDRPERCELLELVPDE